jgi:hypothetical protein
VLLTVFMLEQAKEPDYHTETGVTEFYLSATFHDLHRLYICLSRSIECKLPVS